MTITENGSLNPTDAKLEAAQQEPRLKAVNSELPAPDESLADAPILPMSTQAAGLLPRRRVQGTGEPTPRYLARAMEASGVEPMPNLNLGAWMGDGYQQEGFRHHQNRMIRRQMVGGGGAGYRYYDEPASKARRQLGSLTEQQFAAYIASIVEAAGARKEGTFSEDTLDVAICGLRDLRQWVDYQNTHHVETLAHDADVFFGDQRIPSLVLLQREKDELDEKINAVLLSEYLLRFHARHPQVMYRYHCGFSLGTDNGLFHVAITTSGQHVLSLPTPMALLEAVDQMEKRRQKEMKRLEEEARIGHGNASECTDRAAGDIGYRF